MLLVLPAGAAAREHNSKNALSKRGQCAAPSIYGKFPARGGGACQRYGDGGRAPNAGFEACPGHRKQMHDESLKKTTRAVIEFQG